MLFVGQLPSVGNDADDGDKERDEEEEKLRREAIKEAEEKRRVKHKKMEEERETLRQGIRDKVTKVTDNRRHSPKIYKKKHDL